VRAPDDLTPVAFEAMAGFDRDSLDDALETFRRTAQCLLSGAEAQRPACPAPAGLIAAAQASLADEASGDVFFRRWFQPFRLQGAGFVTAYYEPEVAARRFPEAGFQTPVLSRPPDLVTLNDAPLVTARGETLTSARRNADGALTPYPDRRAICEDGAATGATPIAFVRDAVELFLMQVQGSARLRLPDGDVIALTYAGRNGWPYTSIGKLMIARNMVAPEKMSLALLKSTLRDLGPIGERLMHENQSYVFFQHDETPDRRLGPIGGAGCALTPLRSIAVDRSIWCYGLPFWISTQVPWERAAATGLERLMIAQDTGSAILGAARADLFFGAGDDAGARAGSVRHDADFIVFLPREQAAS